MLKRGQWVIAKDDVDTGMLDSQRVFKLEEEVKQHNGRTFFWGVDVTTGNCKTLVSDCRYRVHQDVLFDIDY